MNVLTSKKQNRLQLTQSLEYALGLAFDLGIQQVACVEHL